MTEQFSNPTSFCEAVESVACTTCPLRKIDEETWKERLRAGYIDQPYELKENLRGLFESIHSGDPLVELIGEADQTLVQLHDEQEGVFDERDGSICLVTPEEGDGEIVPMGKLPPSTMAVIACMNTVSYRQCVEGNN